MKPLNRKAGAMAIAVAFVGGAEGLRQVAYIDPVGIPTACFGETKNIRMGMKFSKAECEAMLVDSLIEADSYVQKCVRLPDLPDYRHAALVSFTYNVGGANFCKSTLVRKLNAGDIPGACAELNKWVYAKGIKLPGLVKRRADEYQMCMRGLM